MWISVNQKFIFSSVLIFKLEKGKLPLFIVVLCGGLGFGFGFLFGFLGRGGVCMFNFITTALTSLTVLQTYIRSMS